MTTRVILCILFFFPLLVHAQHPSDTAAKHIPIPYNPLDTKDMIMLDAMPELQLPDEYKTGPKAVLPVSVDNSTQPYTTSVCWQNGYECGQSASIVHNFTFEMDRARNVPASNDANQYVAHFAWDFFNNGMQYGGGGVSFFDTWEVLKYCGTPSVLTYGGIWQGGYLRWMSGYNNYYAAMQNRIEGGYRISAGTPEGLLTLKHWIHDHLDGSAVGGVANYYSGYYSPDATLPTGTPEAGMAVVTSAPGTSHTWTVYGYNDSIRYDYNNDGQYTNHLDINGDGIVDMRDWEKGGLKIRNGYSGPGWGNNSYSYLMYKTLAEPNSTHGVWNNSTYILKVKPTYNPLMTMKASVKYTCRNKLKIIAGISTNLSATRPDKILDFPIFNYQGGAYYMQGDTSQAAKTIEFGLDISPLLSEINSGQPAKYFLLVIEKDPSGADAGIINNMSVIDYTNGTAETACSSSNISLNNNDTTTLSVNTTVNFSKVSIATASLSQAHLYQPFSQQLQAVGGTPPYQWQLLYDYTEAASIAAFPAATAEQLTLQNTDARLAVKKIEFPFPFCGQTYDTIYVSQDGFIRFDNSAYTWPYLSNRKTLFTATRLIAPFQTPMNLTGLWYQGDMNSATFTWKTTASGQSGSNINFSLKLYPSGKIEFYYGTISFTGDISWFAGLSDNYRNTYFSPISNSFNNNTTGRKIELTPFPSPGNVTLSDDGLLTYTPVDECNTCSLKVRVSDNNLVKADKTFPVNTGGVLISYSYTAGMDTIVEAKDTVRLTVYLKNIGSGTINNARMLLRDTGTHVSFLDSTETLTPLLPNITDTFPQAFTFIIDSTVIDGAEINLDAFIYSAADTFTGTVTLTARAFILNLGRVTISDGNDNILQPGEASALIVELLNTGGASAYNLNATLFTWDPYVSITSDESHISSLSGGETKNLFYIIDVNHNAPLQHQVVFIVDITGSNGYLDREYFCVNIGEIMETFETGDFSRYPWTFADSAWYVTDSIAYAGSYCVRTAKYLADNQKSTLIISMNIISDAYISFYRKVSCESHPGYTNYDWLAFYIDGTEMERWDGNLDWALKEYPVNAGQRTFKWTFSKDYSVSWGGDAAWLDNILFPPFGIPVFGTPGNTNSSGDLGQNYPNPFHDFTNISFIVQHASTVTLKVFDVTGKMVRTLIKGESTPAGNYSLRWDGSGDNGAFLSNGVYYYSLQTGKSYVTKKMILNR